MTDRLRELLEQCPVVPVVTVEDVRHAVPLARALQAGGIDVIEVTLRSDAAWGAIERIREELPEVRAGVGTAVRAGDLERAQAAGAAFAVSPGLVPDLVRRAADLGLPYLPGVASASEVMAALGLGLETLKFFPARPAGGIPMLKAFAPVFPTVRFCPTGGVTPDDLGDYLGLPNVVCVGGSWLTPGPALQAGDWEQITRLAAAAIDRAGRTA
ncbi:MAG: bifunctional 4-hydroxy-2-oxoglutarate aldolase/2-dehydro-3-deoxy-phosphogluconate aldolase [Geminicoccaceae bacterium]|nr:bifunctional 4-hydroxy-2-oxoglutarate aldolase/2-dehydro-3-deoxy-phosphogluconate aldolase [Geminicoccaceae bacterium]